MAYYNQYEDEQNEPPQRTSAFGEQSGIAIAPPPPVPPTPAPTLSPPPNEFGEPDGMDLQREMLGELNTGPQAPAAQPAAPEAPAVTSSPTAPPVSNTAITPNVPPPPPTAPVASAPPIVTRYDDRPQQGTTSPGDPPPAIGEPPRPPDVPPPAVTTEPQAPSAGYAPIEAPLDIEQEMRGLITPSSPVGHWTEDRPPTEGTTEDVGVGDVPPVTTDGPGSTPPTAPVPTEPELSEPDIEREMMELIAPSHGETTRDEQPPEAEPFVAAPSAPVAPVAPAVSQVPDLAAAASPAGGGRTLDAYKSPGVHNWQTNPQGIPGNWGYGPEYPAATAVWDSVLSGGQSGALPAQLQSLYERYKDTDPTPWEMQTMRNNGVLGANGADRAMGTDLPASLLAALAWSRGAGNQSSDQNRIMDPRGYKTQEDYNRANANGPDTRGYIKTEGDPYGEDEANQERIQQELRDAINSGAGSQTWDPSGMGGATPATPESHPPGWQPVDDGSDPPVVPPVVPPGTGVPPKQPVDDPVTPVVPPRDGGGSPIRMEPVVPRPVTPRDDLPTLDPIGKPVVPPVTQRPTIPLGEFTPPPIEKPGLDYDFKSGDPMSVFNQSADAMEARLERSRQQGQRGIGEIAAKRGVLGGSPELGMYADLESELNVQRQEGLAGLQREAAQFGLQNRAQELQQLGMNRDEAYRYAGMEQDQAFQTRAMELQQYGIDSNMALQYAQLEQDSGFRGRALELQRAGMDMDESYRYAAMAQDAKFREAATALQKQGMAQDEAYRQAALEWEKKSGQQQLTTDQQRLVSQVQAMLYDGGIEKKHVPEWIRDIIDPNWRKDPNWPKVEQPPAPKK